MRAIPLTQRFCVILGITHLIPFVSNISSLTYVRLTLHLRLISRCYVDSQCQVPTYPCLHLQFFSSLSINNN